MFQDPLKLFCRLLGNCWLDGEFRKSIERDFLPSQVAVAVLPLNVAYSVLGRWLFGGVTCKVGLKRVEHSSVHGVLLLFCCVCICKIMRRSRVIHFVVFGVAPIIPSHPMHGSHPLTAIHLLILLHTQPAESMTYIILNQPWTNWCFTVYCKIRFLTPL